MICATRHSIRQDLLAYGEAELAIKLDQANDDDLDEIGRLAMKYISEGGYISKHTTLGAIEFFERKRREPKRKRRDMSAYLIQESTPKENLIERMFRRSK